MVKYLVAALILIALASGLALQNSVINTRNATIELVKKELRAEKKVTKDLAAMNLDLTSQVNKMVDIDNERQALLKTHRETIKDLSESEARLQTVISKLGKSDEEIAKFLANPTPRELVDELLKPTVPGG